MRISVTIEADSAEDYQDAVAALYHRDYRPFASVALHTPKEESDHDIYAPEPTSKSIEEPVPAAVPAEAGPAAEEPEAAPQQAPQRKPRGRARRAPAEATRPIDATPVTKAAPREQTPDMRGQAGATRDDLMRVFQGYVHAYGTANGYADVSNILKENFGPDVRKASDVTDDNLGAAIAAVSQAIEANPYSRKRANAQ